jgi:hypothetical protein
MGGSGSGKPPQNLVGQKFNRLTVLRLMQCNPVIWECRCDCGTITKIVSTGDLKSGNTKSCGCLKPEKVAERCRLRPYEALYNSFVKARSKPSSQSTKVYPLELTYEEFLEFIPTPACHYCGFPITWSEYNPHKNGSGYYLDRKDNELGYSKDNLVVCCSRCNRGKSDQFTYHEWVEVGKCLRRLREEDTNA